MSPIELLLFVMSSTIIFGVIDCRPGSVYRNRLRKQLTTAVGNNRRLYSRYPCNRNAPTGICKCDNQIGQYLNTIFSLSTNAATID
jgi:hypothetical protein